MTFYIWKIIQKYKQKNVEKNFVGVLKVNDENDRIQIY